MLNVYWRVEAGPLGADAARGSNVTGGLPWVARLLADWCTTSLCYRSCVTCLSLFLVIKVVQALRGIQRVTLRQLSLSQRGKRGRTVGTTGAPLVSTSSNALPTHVRAGYCPPDKCNYSLLNSTVLCLVLSLGFSLCRPDIQADACSPDAYNTLSIHCQDQLPSSNCAASV